MDSNPIRSEALRFLAEMFALSYARYRNTSSVQVLIEYLSRLDDNQVGTLLREAEAWALDDLQQAVQETVTQEVGALH